MAVLSGKNTFAVDFFFYSILNKRLAQSARNVGKSNVDVQNLLFVDIYSEFIRQRAWLERRTIILFLARKALPPPLINMVSPNNIIKKALACQSNFDGHT